MRNKFEDLEKLSDLHSRGVIDDTEYQHEKEKLLNGSVSSDHVPLFGLVENTYLMLMHLSLLLGFVYPFLGVVAPLLLWLTNKDRNPNVDRHGRVIMNYMISFAIYTGVLALLMIPFGMFFSMACLLSPVALFAGFFPLVGVALLGVVFVVMAAVKANDGVLWHYPLCIRFFKVDEL